MLRGPLNLLAGDGRKLIADLERTEALHTGVEGPRGLFAALPADEVSGVAEGARADAVRSPESVSSTAVMRLSFIICLGRLSTEPELAPFLFGQPVAGESPGRSLSPSG